MASLWPLFLDFLSISNLSCNLEKHFLPSSAYEPMNCLFVFLSVSFCILLWFTVRTSATISTNNGIPRAIKGSDECVLHRPSHALPHLPLKMKMFSPKISTTIIFGTFYWFTMHAKQTRWLGVRERKSKSYPKPTTCFVSVLKYDTVLKCCSAVIQTEWPNRSKSPDA